MKCPSCGTPLGQSVLQCPNCRLSLRELDTKFGAVPRHTRYLTDRSGQLPLPAIRKLRGLLEIFEKKFPQSLFSVFVTNYVQDGSMAEFTFWLANRARLSSLQSVMGDNFDILLGIDIDSGEAALTIGYGLENYLTEDDLKAALGVAENAFRAGNFPDGIRACVQFMMDRLREIAKANEKLASPMNAGAGGDY